MQDKHLSTEELIAQDVGARLPEGLMARIIAGLALLWSLFQLWIASPLPFVLGVVEHADTEHERQRRGDPQLEQRPE